MSTISRSCCVVVFALYVFAIGVDHAFSQTSRQTPSNRHVAEKQSLKGMSSELERHTRLLQRALTRYMSAAGITPYIDSVGFWLELRESRINSGMRFAKDRAVLSDAFARLEDDIVQLMLDDQLGLYHHELELNEHQYVAIEKILRSDAEAKVRLLKDSPAGGVFIREVSSISMTSEASIRKILFLEQQKIYDKRQSEARMIWTA